MFAPQDVAAIACETVRTVLLPAFRELGALKTREKEPGEIVTEADESAQLFLEKELKKLRPQAAFLGEEETGGNRPAPGQLAGIEELFLVDPLDGTANFAAGVFSFCVLVAWVRRGVVRGSWIAIPSQRESGELGLDVASAWEDDPALFNGEPFRKPPDGPATREGIAGTRFLAPELRESVVARLPELGNTRPPGSAGCDILDVAQGRFCYALYARTLPWDFAAPLHWAMKAGLCCRRLDATPVVLAPGQTGLLCANSEEDWRTVHEVLFMPERGLPPLPARHSPLQVA